MVENLLVKGVANLREQEVDNVFHAGQIGTDLMHGVCQEPPVCSCVCVRCMKLGKREGEINVNHLMDFMPFRPFRSKLLCRGRGRVDAADAFLAETLPTDI